MKEMDWTQFDLATVSKDLFDLLSDHVAGFFMSHTKQELFEEAVRRRMTIYPVTTMEDIAKNPHLAARDYLQEIEHPELDMTLSYPGISSSQPSLCVRDNMLLRRLVSTI